MRKCKEKGRDVLKNMNRYFVHLHVQKPHHFGAKRTKNHVMTSDSSISQSVSRTVIPIFDVLDHVFTMVSTTCSCSPHVFHVFHWLTMVNNMLFHHFSIFSMFSMLSMLVSMLCTASTKHHPAPAGPALSPLALRCLGALAAAEGQRRPEMQRVLKTWMRSLVKIRGGYGRVWLRSHY